MREPTLRKPPITLLLAAALLSGLLLRPTSAQIQEKDKFTIRITKIQRVREGCTVEAVTDKLRYRLSSDFAIPLWLKAGESYKAMRGEVSEVGTVLIIFNNAQNGLDSNNVVMNIEAEEAR